MLQTTPTTSKNTTVTFTNVLERLEEEIYDQEGKVRELREKLHVLGHYNEPSESKEVSSASPDSTLLQRFDCSVYILKDINEELLRLLRHINSIL